MKMPWQEITWKTSIKTNLLLGVCLVASIASNVMLINHMSEIRERVVLTPVTIDQKMGLGWSDADESYLRAIGLSIAQLVGNLTPDNLKFVSDSLSKMTDSSIYPEIRKALISLSKDRQYREMVASSKFVATNILYETKTNKVFVNGGFKTVATTGVTDRNVTFEIVLKIVNGKAVIFGFNTYEGEPKTIEVLERVAATPVEPAQKGNANEFQQ